MNHGSLPSSQLLGSSSQVWLTKQMSSQVIGTNSLVASADVANNARILLHSHLHRRDIAAGCPFNPVGVMRRHVRMSPIHTIGVKRFSLIFQQRCGRSAIIPLSPGYRSKCASGIESVLRVRVPNNEYRTMHADVLVILWS